MIKLGQLYEPSCVRCYELKLYYHTIKYYIVSIFLLIVLLPHLVLSPAIDSGAFSSSCMLVSIVVIGLFGWVANHWSGFLELR